MIHRIIRPIVTEKSSHLIATFNKYSIQVSLDADKENIRRELEKLFNVKVVKVHTSIYRKAPRKLGKFPGKRKLLKKAIVTLKEGDKLEFVAK